MAGESGQGQRRRESRGLRGGQEDLAAMWGFWFESKGRVRTAEGFVGKGLANIFRGTPCWWE